MKKRVAILISGGGSNMVALAPPNSIARLNAVGFDNAIRRTSGINPRLKGRPNVVLLPHMASATEEGRLEMGEKVIINVKTFADGHRPPDQVVPSML